MADLLRGDYKQSEYGKVILPLTVLRRFDCVLAPVKQDMLATYANLKGISHRPFVSALVAPTYGSSSAPPHGRLNQSET